MREKKGEGRPSSATRENITLVDHRNLRNRSPFRPCTNLIRPMHGMRNDRVLLLCTYMYVCMYISISKNGVLYQPPGGLSTIEIRERKGGGGGAQTLRPDICFSGLNAEHSRRMKYS